jgi:hypothetical protein
MSTSAVPSTTQATGSLLFTLSLARSGIPLCDGIDLQVEIRNSSHESFALMSTLAVYGYSLTLRDHLGHDVERTAEGVAAQTPLVHTRAELEVLRPGAVYRESISRVERLFKIASPGEYTLVASRRMSHWNDTAFSHDPFKIRSTALKFRVVPAVSPSAD